MAIQDFNFGQEDKDCTGKCLYILTQIKFLNKKEWRKLNDEYDDIDLDETYDFFQKLVLVYNKLLEEKEK